MPASWMILLLAAVPFVCVLNFLGNSRRRKDDETPSLPPGPKGLPLLGSLMQLGDLPHRNLHKLAKEYGPIMYMRLGLVPVIVISSPQAAQQFLKTYDQVFAGRPLSEFGRFGSHQQKGVGFTQYGSYWRKMRKVCNTELLAGPRIESFKSMRKEEVGRLLQSVTKAAATGLPTDLTAQVSAFSTDMTCRMVFGKRYIDMHSDKKSFKEALADLVYLAGAFQIPDYIPLVGPLDLQGYRRRMKNVRRYFDGILDKIIDEHLEDSDERSQKDFVDYMLMFMNSSDNEFQFDRINIKVLIFEMLVGALDTTSTTIEWVMSELLKHPRVMKKVQEELQVVVGMDRAVEESDLANLEYLNMVVKETMRLYPVAPLLLPHESLEDSTVNGFYIPKESRVLINAWAIGRDPDAWQNPDDFYPERFLGISIDVKGHDFQLIPFGSGRRGCPGLQLGFTVVRLVVAQLVHCFDWRLPNGMSAVDLDMNEKFGIVTPRVNNLRAIPVPRLREDICVAYRG